MSLPLSWPTNLDLFANPGPTTETDDPGYELDLVIARLHNLAMAMEAKLGITASTPAAGTILGGAAGGSTTYRKLAGADVTPGANNSVFATNGSGAVGFLQNVTAGTYLSANGQALISLSMPFTGASVAAAGAASPPIQTNAHIGFCFAINHGTGQCALFMLQGGVNTTVLLAGQATAWDVVSASNNSKINCIYSSGSYYLQNGFPSTAMTLSAIYLGT